MPVLSTSGGMSAKGFGFSAELLRPATSFITFASTVSTNVTATTTVPLGYNAIHIQAAVGGGGGGLRGADYKASGESAGSGGGSGAFISDKIFKVVGGEILTLVAGGLGVANQGTYSNSGGSDGGNTTLSGVSTGAIFNLTGGSDSRILTNGAFAGPLRTNVQGFAGTANIIALSISSGVFRNQSNIVVSVTTNTSGPVSTFNQSGNGADGVFKQNCSGDNCGIVGGPGGPSYAGTIPGGTGENPGVVNGTRGSGGGGGSSNAGGGPDPSNGGPGEIIYRFLQVKQ
jgi:hypothetical protein